MKKVLCYIALVLLVALIITPPLVRVFYKEEEEVVEKDRYEVLVCNKDNYSISSSYKNGVPLNIKFQLLKDNPDLQEPNDAYLLEYYLYLGLKDLSYVKIEESVNNNQEGMISYYLVYENSNQSDLAPLGDYRYQITEQRQIYERAGYSCSVIE